ncbi:TrkA family potassium uptake protein [bacterium]|nr:TrkA family potassium uptake protein [bacterium]MCG2676498.1 TrkA family potassium uptake protein [bacterium]MCG2677510.1 TrkA family potassium uptake protein [bacterium]
MARQFAVIGLGRFGSSVARTLVNAGCEVLAIDESEEKVKEISDLVTQAVELDGTDEKALKAVGIEDVDVAIVAIATDMLASILITLLLKEIGVKEVVAKALNARHGRILQKIGADKVIFPEREMGERLAQTLVTPSVLEQIELAPGHSIMEIVAPKAFVGKTIRDLNIRAKYEANIITIKKKVPHLTKTGETDFVETVNMTPKAEDRIEKGDHLMVIGKDESLSKLKKLSCKE